MKKQLMLIVFLVSLYPMTIAQNVGIGTNSPYRAKLEVHGAVDATSAIFGGESSGISLQRNWPGIGFNTYYGNGNHRTLSDGHGAMMVLDPANGYLAFDMMWNTPAGNYGPIRRAMVMSKEGRVNIASASYPYANLNVAKGNLYPFYATAAFEGSVHHSYFSYGDAENTYIRAGKDNGTVFINDIPNSKVAISGKVGIGTATPGSSLEIRQNGSQPAITMVNGHSFLNWGWRVETGGNLYLDYNNNTVGRYWTDGSYNAISDSRLKTNVHQIPSVLNKVLKLQPVDYEMIHNNPGHKKSIGFLAQDVKKVFPELVSVTTDSIGNYNNITDLHALNYSGFGVLAIKAIQEQQEIINELKQNNSSQQKLIDALMKRIEKLESIH